MNQATMQRILLNTKRITIIEAEKCNGEKIARHPLVLQLNELIKGGVKSIVEFKTLAEEFTTIDCKVINQSEDPTLLKLGEQVQLKGFYGSKCIGVNPHSKNMEAAVAFAAFLGNEENQMLRYEKSGQIPANINASSSEAVQADPLTKVILSEVESASVAQPASSLFGSRYWTYANTIPTEIRSGVLNKDNVQAKMDTFVSQMTAK